MSCNFYTIKGTHIGKRSAAGLYCWDCNITLNKDGNDGVHEYKSLWYIVCPKCGKKPIKEDFSNNSAGRELGFNKQPMQKKTGVASCSSFTWAISSSKAKNIKLIKDEYGKLYTNKQFFNEVLSECPIQFYHLIGKQFS